MKSSSGVLLGLCLSMSAMASAASAAVTCQPVRPNEVYTGYLGSPGKISPEDGTCFVNKLSVTTHDGLKLVANVFLPKISSPNQTFPTIIMVNSWVMPEWEYIGQAKRLAADGYIVYEYASRGWWQSEGMARVAAPEDIQDVSTIIDWLGQNLPVDKNNIAVSGISYGAGISLLALGREPRLKTAVALSGWGSLEDEFFFQESTNMSNIKLLVGVAPLTGRLDPNVVQLRDDLINPNTTEARADEIRAWAKIRSPLFEVEHINARQAPVFMSKNYSDEMFTPNASLRMFSQLTGPKKLLLNKGWHAVPEIPGAILNIDNYIYDQAHRWFDYWLKGKDTGIVSEPQVDMAVNNDSSRERLATWPDATVRQQTMYIAPRGTVRFDLSCLCTRGMKGDLQSSPNVITAVDTISSQSDTVASTGIPTVSELLSGFGLFPTTTPALVTRAHGVVYQGPVLSKPLKIRGIPKVQIQIKPSQSQSQVMAYLYDVDALGVGKLITHGVRSTHWGPGGQELSFPIDLHMMAYNVPAGHRLNLILDTQDKHYAPASTHVFTVDIRFAPNKVSTLTIPTIN